MIRAKADDALARIAEIEKGALPTEVHRETYDGDGSQRLVLRSPARAILSLSIDGLAIPDRVYRVNVTPGYFFKIPNEITLAGYVFTQNRGNVVVVYEPVP